MIKKYLIYMIKKYKTALIFLAVVYLGIMLFPIMNLYGIEYSGAGDVPPDELISDVYPIYFAIHFSMVLTLVCPALFFRFVHSRKEEDQILALPMSRRELLLGNLCFSYGIAGGYFAAGSLLVWIFVDHGQNLSFGTLICGLLTGLLFCLMLTVFNTMLYLLGNNVVDGCLIMAGYNLLPFALMFGFYSLFSSVVAGSGDRYLYDAFVGKSFWRYLSPLWMTHTGFKGMSVFENYDFVSVLPLLIGAAVYVVLCGFGLRKLFVERKAEQAEQLSDGFFAYPLLIMLYLVSSMFIAVTWYGGGSGLFIRLLLLLVAYVIASFIYRRQIRVKLSMLATFATVFAACMIFREVGLATQAFGLAKSVYPIRGRYVAYGMTARVPELAEAVREDGHGYREMLMEHYGPESEYEKKYEIWLANVNVYIDRQRMEEPQVKKVVDQLESVRMRCIDDWYEQRGDQDIDSLSSMSLQGTDRYDVLDNNSIVATYYGDIQFDLNGLRQLTGKNLKKDGMDVEITIQLPGGHEYTPVRFTVEEFEAEAAKEAKDPDSFETEDVEETEADQTEMLDQGQTEAMDDTEASEELNGARGDTERSEEP